MSEHIATLDGNRGRSKRMTDRALVATDTANPASGCGFWALWVLASALGWTVGFPIADAILSVLGKAVADEIVIWAMFGAAPGILQWLLLRRHLPRAGRWVLASTLGGALIGVVGSTAPDVDPAVSSIVAGASIGILQWLVLRRHIAYAGWWLLASPVGWAVSALAIRTAERVGAAFGVAERGLRTVVALPMSETVILALVLGAFGAVSGVVTGIVLAWLMQGQGPEAHRRLAYSVEAQDE
jgi:hypothetical protein